MAMNFKIELSNNFKRRKNISPLNKNNNGQKLIKNLIHPDSKTNLHQKTPEYKQQTGTNGPQKQITTIF
jgi:hypothetical protein